MPSRPVRPGVASSLVAVLAVALVAGPAPIASAGGGPTDCLVTNTSRPAPRPTFGTLQAAVTDAASGEKLTLRGRCETGEVFIEKNLTITGVRRNKPDSGRPTLSGAIAGERLLAVHGVSLTLKGLRLTGGDGTGAVLSGFGGAILMNGQVTPARLVLTDSSIQGSSADVGGGIAGLGAASVVLAGTTRVKGNQAVASGGGVYLQGTDARLTLKGSAGITGNHTGPDGFGGGVYVERGRVGMGGTSAISGNTASVGGGLYLLDGSLTVGGSGRIASNRARWGAAISHEGTTTVDTIRLKGHALITKNVVTGEYSSAMFLLNGSSGTTLALVLEDNAAIAGNDLKAHKGTAVVLLRETGGATIDVTMTEGSRVKLNKVGTGGAPWLYVTACGTLPALTGVGPRTVNNTPASPKVLASGSNNYC